MKVFLGAVFFLFFLAFIFSNFLKGLFYLSESSVAKSQVVFVGPRNLDQYSILALRQRPFSGSDFKIEKTLKETSDFSSYLFSFLTKGLKVTGMINIPKGEGPFPVVLMVRGYVDREKYSTGVGTSRVADFLAAKGYLTIAPDFLGFGGSDWPSVDPFEERFRSYTTLIDLYGLVTQKRDGDCQFSNPPTGAWRASDWRAGVKCELIYIWAHSNGGQIALTFLEVTGLSIPTALWAPVSKPFPYSILYFTDEMSDRGKELRKALAKFEGLYDVNKYSLAEYLDSIKAPILLQQGTADPSVPRIWSDELYQKLQDLGKEAVYEVYEGADHNLLGSWDKAVQRDWEFFQTH